jgi:hypothetical protein
MINDFGLDPIGNMIFVWEKVWNLSKFNDQNITTHFVYFSSGLWLIVTSQNLRNYYNVEDSHRQCVMQYHCVANSFKG